MEVSKDLEKFQKNILQNYLCIICQEYAIDIQVSSCACSAVFCKECAKPVKTCPICKIELNISPVSFRILNILKEIPEYKKHYEEIELLKIPTVKDLEDRWPNSSYTETNFSLSPENKAKAQEISRRIFWYLINKFPTKDDIKKVIFDISMHRPFSWAPLLLYKSDQGDLIIGGPTFISNYKLNDKHCQIITLIFRDSEIKEEVPYNIANLFFEKFS